MGVSPISLDRLDGGVVVAAVSGEQDVGTAPQLRECLSEALAERSPLVVDLNAAVSLDSAILGVLLSGLRRAREQGSAFALVVTDDAESPVRRLFEVTGLMVVFPIFSTRDSAVAAVSVRTGR
jgi:anti-sigma B factor antagonist